MLTGHGARTGIYHIIVVEHTNDKGLPRSIKNNIPGRAIFRLSSASESKAIGYNAENLQPAELLYQPNFGSQDRLQGIFMPESNVKEVVEATK